MITRQTIEGRIKQAQQNEAVTIGRDELIALCTLALQRLDVEPRPIEDAPRDSEEPLLCFGGGLDDVPDICRYNEKVGVWSCSFYILDDTDNEPEGYNRPRYFIPLSSLPKAKNDGPR